MNTLKQIFEKYPDLNDKSINCDEKNVSKIATNLYLIKERANNFGYFDVVTFCDSAIVKIQPFADQLNIVKQTTVDLLDNHSIANKLTAPWHDIEKLSGVLRYNAKGESEEVQELAAKLDDAVEEVCSFFRKGTIDSESLLQKYSHNIPSVIKPNDQIVFFKHDVGDKKLLGNKGFNLLELYRNGINIPKTIVLTTKFCNDVFINQKVLNIDFLVRVCHYFKTNKIAVRSSGVYSMPGMMQTMLNIDCSNPEELETAILKVVNSWNSDPAKRFREITKLSDEVQLAVVLQEMINPTNEGYSGVLFTKNPTNGKNEIIGEYLPNQYGEALVQGKETPLSIKNLADEQVNELTQIANKLETYFKYPQDIEFVSNGKEIFIVQTRSLMMTPKIKLFAFAELLENKIIQWADFLKHVSYKYQHLVYEVKHPKKVKPIGNGNGVGSDCLTGLVVFDDSNLDLSNRTILFCNITTPEDLSLVDKCDGIVTKIGGITSHPAVLCQKFNKAGIVGVSNLVIDKTTRTVTIGSTKLKEYDLITIVPYLGQIFKGQPEFEFVYFGNKFNELKNKYANGN